MLSVKKADWDLQATIDSFISTVALAMGVAPAGDVDSTAFPFPLFGFGAGLAALEVGVLVLILIVVGSLVLKRLLKLLESSFQAVLSNPSIVEPNDEALEPSRGRPRLARSRLEQGTHGPHPEMCGVSRG